MVKLLIKIFINSILQFKKNYLRIWTQWRAASGAKMRADYKIYVDLLNEAAKLNGR